MKFQTLTPGSDQRKNRSLRVGIKNRRGAFTLVELIVVILVIGILMSLIFPAVNRVISNARIATVVAEIKSLESAITAFKEEYGVTPPSFILLYEDANGWTNDTSQPTRESRAILSRIWPDFDFAYSGAATPGQIDIDGNGSIRSENDGPLVLTGAECLVFFLGGICTTQDASGVTIVDANGNMNSSGVPVKWQPLGFSTNGRIPFRRGGTRKGPFHEFDPGRLVNVNDPSALQKSLPEYLDTLPGQIVPYLYASSNEGRGYNFVPPATAGDPPIQYADVNLGPSLTTESPYYIYLQSDPDNPDAFGTSPTANTDLRDDVPYNSKSYQIISAGQDFLYGVGGIYDQENGIPSTRPLGTLPAVSALPENEKDNITNFSGGVLDAS